MAGITGIFTADFKSFYDAVAQARVKLKDFQSDAEAVAQKVDRVANAFSGRKLVQDAEIMTKAITEIGGATALTAKEQAQVNAKLAEAIYSLSDEGALGLQIKNDIGPEEYAIIENILLADRDNMMSAIADLNLMMSTKTPKQWEFVIPK